MESSGFVISVTGLGARPRSWREDTSWDLLRCLVVARTQERGRSMSMCTAASNLPILILMTSDEPLNQASDDSVQAPSTRAGHRWALPAIGALATAAAYITAFLLTA